MPLYFWGDVDNTRYLDSYFREFPGVWRHGDWISIGKDGSCVIYGRSDATLNRSGLRMGTSEIYGAVETLPEILDSMVIDLEYLGRPSHMELFVVLRADATLDVGLEDRIRQAIRVDVVPPLPARPDFPGACDPAYAVWQKAGSAYQEALSRPFRRGRRQS